MKQSTRIFVSPASSRALLVALTLLVFWSVPFHDWVEIDDTDHVTENPRFFPLTWDGVVAFWTGPFLSLYVPVSYMLFGAECIVARTIAGEGPTAPIRAGLFHAVSLAIHSGVMMLVWRILARFIVRPEAIFLGVALFAWHPLQVESVAWVSEQRGLLAAMFSFMALVGLLTAENRAAAKRNVWPFHAAATLAFAAALLSKPVAVVTPLLGLALLYPCRTSEDERLPWVLRLWLAMALVAAVATRWAQPASMCGFHAPLVSRPLIAGDALGFYLGKLLVPRDLCVAYGRKPSVVLADPSSPVAAILVGAALVAVFAVPRLRSWRLPVVLFVTPLVPVLGLTEFAFQNQSTVADRYAYMAMLGPALGLGLLADHILGTGRAGAVVRGAIFCGMTVLALTAWRQVATWRNTGTLAAHAVRVEPEVTGSWTMLANYWLESGDPRRAIACAEQSLRLDPQNVTAVYSIVRASARLGRPKGVQAAIDRLHVLGEQPLDIADSYYICGVTNLKAGRTRDAIVDFEIAVSEVPRHAAALTNLGIALTRTGELNRAIEVLRAAVAAKPDQAGAWVGLGNALLLGGRAAEAVACYDRELSIAPDDGATLLNRARARLELGNADGAAEDLSQAIRLGMRPDAELTSRVNQSRGDE
jgi:protein O-mannosyl-transferase